MTTRGWLASWTRARVGQCPAAALGLSSFHGYCAAHDLVG